jgi:predicted tellurium resistance membrane protein TerC
VMIFAAGPISEFVDKHPTIKMLALSFLLLIGFTLIVEGLHQHIPKGYIYFAMGFSILVEMLNLRMRARAEQPVNLRKAYVDVPAGTSVPVPATVTPKKATTSSNKAKKKKK